MPSPRKAQTYGKQQECSEVCDICNLHFTSTTENFQSLNILNNIILKGCVKVYCMGTQ